MTFNTYVAGIMFKFQRHRKIKSKIKLLTFYCNFTRATTPFAFYSFPAMTHGTFFMTTQKSCPIKSSRLRAFYISIAMTNRTCFYFLRHFLPPCFADSSYQRLANDKLSGSVLRSVAEQNRIRWSAWLGVLFIFPFKTIFLFRMKIPYSNSAVKNTDYCSHAFCMSIKLPITKKTADKTGDFVSPNIKIYKTVF